MKKKLLQLLLKKLEFLFEKITCCAKRERKKITCREENPSPPGYQMVRP